MRDGARIRPRRSWPADRSSRPPRRLHVVLRARQWRGRRAACSLLRSAPSQRSAMRWLLRCGRRDTSEALVLCDATGQPLTQTIIQMMMRKAARRANVKAGVHILRPTFCSHLAMRGAPAPGIQELAGHQDLQTQRYMHPQSGRSQRGNRDRRVRLKPDATASSQRSIACADSDSTERASVVGKRAPACRPKRVRPGPPSPRLRRATFARSEREGWREPPRRGGASAPRGGECYRGPTERSDKWRRRDSHPRPKIHPRRNLRCVSASEISFPA